MPGKKKARLPASKDMIKKVSVEKQTPLLFFSHPEVNKKKIKVNDCFLGRAGSSQFPGQVCHELVFLIQTCICR